MCDLQYTDLSSALDLKDCTAVQQWLAKYNVNIDKSTSVPQWKQDYIGTIFTNGYLRINDYRVGMTIPIIKGGGSYQLSKPMGDASQFRALLTPDQMLRLGVFGGKYITGFRKEIPVEWVLLALCEDKLRPLASTPDVRVNHYGVWSGQSLAEWQQKGWIYDHDPLGWFQWYVRYYIGRRCSDDAKQMARWKAFKRHLGQVQANPHQPRIVQKQALIQWAYPPM